MFRKAVAAGVYGLRRHEQGEGMNLSVDSSPFLQRFHIRMTFFKTMPASSRQSIKKIMPLPNTSKFISARRCEERIPMSAANPRFLQSVNWQPLVLIVETDEDTRLMMKYLLQMWRCEVIETADAEEALKFTETRQPDVILISGKVRQGDILTTIKRMREMSPPGKTTIVHISAFSEPAVGASALAAGADNFLVKPIDFEHLEKMLHKHLEPEIGAGEMFFINL